MTDDLSTRLLAAIKRVENAATEAGGESWDYNGSQILRHGGRDRLYVHPTIANHIYLNDPAAVLRLCQAHREIVTAYLTAQGQVAKLMADRAHGQDVIEAQGVANGLDLAVQSLAHGYGIEA